MPRATLDAELVEKYAGYVPLELCVRLRMLYIGNDMHNRPLVVVAAPLTPEEMQEVSIVFGQDPALRIARDSEIAAGLRYLRGETDAFRPLPEGATSVPLLGDLLIEHGLVNKEAFDAAMDAYRPEEHGRIGDYLVESGVIERHVIEQVVEEQRRLRAAQESQP